MTIPILASDPNNNLVTEAVDKARRRAYSERVDPLITEATLKRFIGEIEDADMLSNKAAEERASIQLEHPWP